MSLLSDLLQRSTGTDGEAYAAPRSVSLDKSRVRPEIVSRTVRVFDPDQLRETFGAVWMEHRLLEPGGFDVRLLRIDTTKLSLEIVRYASNVAINGTWPADRIALLFGLNAADGTIIQGQTFETGALALFDGSTGIDARLAAGSQWAILTFERKVFEPMVLSNDADGIPVGVPLRVHESEMRRLRSLFRAVLDDADLTGRLLRMPGASGAFERDILTAYVNAVVTAERLHPNGLGSLQRRHRLVKKAEEYVIAHLDESIRMDKLCKEVGASARSLEYAFQAIYGMGAMRYLRTIRLNEVRKALLQCDGAGPTTVTATAMDWGFWHLGEFAAAYRRLFGEVPSETLRVATSRRAMMHAA